MLLARHRRKTVAWYLKLRYTLLQVAPPKQLGSPASCATFITRKPTNSSMTCAIRRHPVTDFMLDHRHHLMDDQGSSRSETFPVRSKEDIELAHHLVGHSRGVQDGLQIRNEQISNDSPSPAYDYESPESRMTPSSDQTRRLTPRPSSSERSQRESSQYDAPVIPNIPSGQVCAYVPFHPPPPSTNNLEIAEQAVPLSGGAPQKAKLSATPAVCTKKRAMHPGPQT